VKNTVRAGDWDLGLRAGSVEIEAFVCTLLGDRCREDVGAPDNYSISAVQDTGDVVATALPTLFVGHTALLRSRSLALLAGGLLANLAARDQEAATRDQTAAPGGLLWLDVSTLVTADGRAVLAAGRHRRHVVDRLRALRRAGLRYHPVPEVAVDAGTGEVVITGLEGVDASAAAVIASDPEATDTLASPGRYPVAGWVVVGREGGEPVSSAEAVLRTFSVVTNSAELGGQRVLDGLGRIFTTAPALSVARRGDDVVACLEMLAARA
jgi:hypothetical protein